MLVNLKKILETAESEGYAIPCINTPNEETVPCSDWSGRGTEHTNYH